MPSNDYTELRAWLEGKGAECAGTIGYMLGDEDRGAQFEAWVYGGYNFILARERRLGLTTGAVMLYSQMDGMMGSPVANTITYLERKFAVKDLMREREERLERLERRAFSHHANPGSCALPEAEHFCNRPGGHANDEHHCACGWTWSAHEGDNALLTHPADTKKKPERVRGFVI